LEEQEEENIDKAAQKISSGNQTIVQHSSNAQMYYVKSSNQMLFVIYTIYMIKSLLAAQMYDNV